MYCKYCGEDREEEDFEVANIKGGVRYKRRKCRFCKNKDEQKRRAFLREQINLLKNNTVCEICGFADTRALVFHHRDPNTKRFEIGNALNQGCSLEIILSEVDKCQIVCANCHMIIHA